ncbi:MAG: hypothetical protein LC777_05655, partial [Actinobacteria bacterium]|nr:hypothetical protein [Actinomycetota bacterium]
AMYTPGSGSVSWRVIVIGRIKVLSLIAAPLACLAGASPPSSESEDVGERGSVKGSLGVRIGVPGGGVRWCR